MDETRNNFYFNSQKSYPEIVSNARGVGTLCAIDFPDTNTRNKIVDHLWSNGKLLLCLFFSLVEINTIMEIAVFR